ncbi:hypothetical protein VP01_3753g1 [Puccinia sorghi]|uniref:Uncharacterized protein n=1 Tax=Puccinia sorghi TaxID=27349 RepID=A0A0L6UVR4_9BASI|nr:hypothetical protein VP01_3753g1 [Puccinia sorghi]
MCFLQPVIRTLAQYFIRRLDDFMKKSTKKKSQKRHRIQTSSKNHSPPINLFPTTPTGLPIDFYDPELFNNLLPAQKLNVANHESVSFIPPPHLSISAKSANKEHLSGRKFNEKMTRERKIPQAMIWMMKITEEVRLSMKGRGKGRPGSLLTKSNMRICIKPSSWNKPTPTVCTRVGSHIVSGMPGNTQALHYGNSVGCLLNGKFF